MDVRTLNPMGSDALALAEVIAPQMAGTLTSIAEWIGIVVAAMSVAVLLAVIWAVQLDYEVVAVTPGGTLVPLNQLDKNNEQALRALLAANTPAARVQPEAAGAPGSAAPKLNPAAKAAAPYTTTRRMATNE